MRCCDSCGCKIDDDHPFRICPKCLLAEALGYTVDAAASDPGRNGTDLPRFAGAPRLLPRNEFFEKYDIIERVAEGGQGDVLKVWDRELRRCVAMKRLSENSMASEPAVYRFLAEAQITSQLEHPGILPVFEVGLDLDGKPFYTTQFVSKTAVNATPETPSCGEPFDAAEHLIGDTLADIWKKVHKSEGDWPINRALELLPRICEVVAHAHSRGVIHRDLKPTNVLVGPFGDVRVIDWGSAHVLKESRKRFEGFFGPLDRNVIQTDRGEALWLEPNSPLATAHSGQPITVLFMPPEILSGESDQLGPRTDIYSMGIILYELLAGRPPYSESDGSLPERPELQKRILGGPPTPVRTLNRFVSRDLAAICQTAMAYANADRYESMQELADDIRAALEIRPVQARRPGLLLIAQKWAQRKIGYVLLGGAIVVISSAAYSISRGLKFERDVARQLSALRSADLAARTGQWRNALKYWNEAEAAGYHDGIHLGLQRAQAWTVLSETERARAELNRLERRADLGNQRGSVLLRLGENELFNREAFERGVQHVGEALKAGLLGADESFAKGLLADSTPEALQLFRQTLKLNPYHYGAHCHSLGLEHLLGRHQELEEHLRVFKVLFPDDPSPAFIEASELAVDRRLSEAEARLKPARFAANPDAWKRLTTGLQMLAEAADYFDIDVSLGARQFDRIKLDRLAADVISLSDGADLLTTNSPLRFRSPQLPCLQRGIYDGLEAIRTLMVPLLGNLDFTIGKIKSSWRHHPEALLPLFAGTFLDAQHPREGQKSLALLSIQSELFQMAVDSPSVIPNLGKQARYLAARTQFELARRQHTNSAQARETCLANIRGVFASAKTSAAECRAYFAMAFSLGDHDLARDVLINWEQLQPEDPQTLRSRIQLEIAVGAFGHALKLIDKLLMEQPAEKWGLEQREIALRSLKDLVGPAHPSANPNP